MNPDDSVEKLIIDLQFKTEHAFSNQPKIDKAAEDFTARLKALLLSRLPEKQETDPEKTYKTAEGWAHSGGYNLAIDQVEKSIKELFEEGK